MFQRYHLNKEAIPAGIFLLLAAASMFLQRVIIPWLTDRVAYGIGGLLVIVAILLFTRSRNAACGVFFIILTVAAIIGAIAWGAANVFFPLAALYVAKAICFLGLSIVCLRRKKEPRSGPWFTAVCIYVIALPLIFFYGLQAQDISNHLLYYVTVTDLLLFVGLLLTAIAFRYAPETADSSECDTSSKPQSTQQYREEKTPEVLRQEETKESMDSPVAEQTNSIEKAQVEWLDE